MAEEIGNMTFREMLTNMFETNWMSHHELITICAAAEMYADGRAKHFQKWKTTQKDDDYLSLDEFFNLYKESIKS